MIIKTENIMLIKEVPKDAELTIEVSAAARKLEFKSQCIDTGMNYLYARPIIIDGKRVSFEASVTLSVSLVYIREDGSRGGARGIDSEQTPKSANHSKVGYVDVKAQHAAFAHENRPPYYVLAYLVKATYYGEIKTPYDVYLQTVPKGQTPLAKVPWLESQRGETGATGINPKGYYNDAIEYVEDDTVIINNVANPLNGNSYVCKVSAVTGVEPGVTVGWEGSWYPFVMRGAPGPAAPQALVRYSENASTAEGSDWHATPTLSDVYARFSTDGAVTFGSPIQFKGGKGDDAFPIKIQYSITGAAD